MLPFLKFYVFLPEFFSMRAAIAVRIISAQRLPNDIIYNYGRGRN